MGSAARTVSMSGLLVHLLLYGDTVAVCTYTQVLIMTDTHCLVLGSYTCTHTHTAPATLKKNKKRKHCTGHISYMSEPQYLIHTQSFMY